MLPVMCLLLPLKLTRDIQFIQDGRVIESRALSANAVR